MVNMEIHGVKLEPIITLPIRAIPIGFKHIPWGNTFLRYLVPVNRDNLKKIKYKVIRMRYSKEIDIPDEAIVCGARQKTWNNDTFTEIIYIIPMNVNSM